MLFFKAWLESRVRFLIGATGLTALCSAIVVYYPFTAGRPYPLYLSKTIFDGFAREVFVILSVFLGGGGLLRERTIGCAPFTLALPAARMQLLLVRAAIGLAEVCLLSLIPLALVTTLSPFVRQRIEALRALDATLVWSGCGLVAFAVAFFFSAVLPGEYSGSIVSLAVLLLLAVAFHPESMSGLAWVMALATILMASLTAAMRLSKRQDF
jgi:ABC-2 type transport system permease protein